jgi:hypothetical protein
MRYSQRLAGAVANNIIAFLTSNKGFVAAIVVALGIIVSILNILRPILQRRRELKEAHAKLKIADIQLSTLSRSSNSYEVRFMITNVGKSKAVMRELKMRVLGRSASAAVVETIPEAPMRVNVHRVQLIAGKDLYDIRARAFGPALPPLSFEEAEGEGFLVKMVSREVTRYELRVEAQWYDAKKPNVIHTAYSKEFFLEFPRRVARRLDQASIS